MLIISFHNHVCWKATVRILDATTQFLHTLVEYFYWFILLQSIWGQPFHNVTFLSLQIKLQIFLLFFAKVTSNTSSFSLRFLYEEWTYYIKRVSCSLIVTMSILTKSEIPSKTSVKPYIKYLLALNILVGFLLVSYR